MYSREAPPTPLAAPSSSSQRGQVFLSYGHDPACTSLVRRVKADLEALGWKTWVDESGGITFGDDWRQAITRGIHESQHVLAFLSQHSTRKPGVCRQEVAIALGPKKGHVYTVLVESPKDVTPPLIISHLQWLDMQQWRTLQQADPAAADALYERSFPEIVRVLERNEPFAGEVETLKRWLDPWDGTADLVAAEQGFTGRRWLLDGLVEPLWWRGEQGYGDAEDVPPGEIERWRASLEGSRVFWISAGPGWGKSAVAARLAHAARSRVMAVHFCRHDQPQTRDARSVVRTIAFQMATQLGDYRESLMRLFQQGMALNELNAHELFTRLLGNLLTAEVGGGREAEGRRLIVLDALDETLESGNSELVNLISGEFGKLPAWLGLLVTSRREAPVLRQLCAFGVHHQREDDPRNEDDLHAYAQDWLKTQPLEPDHQGMALKAVVQASEGMFLYLRKLQEAVANKVIPPQKLTEPDRLPKGLGALYELWFKHRFSDIAAYRELQRPFLQLLAAAREPLPLELCEVLLGEDRQVDRLEPLGTLCREEDGRISFFHKSLSDWLVDPKESGRFHADPTKGHEQMTQRLWQVYVSWSASGARTEDSSCWRALGPAGEAYAMRHLPAHLKAADMLAEWEQILTDFAFAMRRTAAGNVDALIADYRTLGMTQSAKADAKLNGWSVRVLESEHLLQRGTPEWPSHRILLQIAVEGPDGSALTRAAQAWVDAGGATWPWMRRRGQASSTRPTACRKVLTAPPMTSRDENVQFRSLALSALDGSLLVGTSDGRVFAMDRLTNGLTEVRRQSGEVACLVASTKGDRFASIANGGRVLVWSRNSSFSSIEFNWLGGHVRLLAFSPDGGLLACGFRDGRVRLHDLDARQWIPWGSPDDDAAPIAIECGQGELVSIAWASEGQILATVGRSDNVRLWNTTDGNLLGTVVPEWCDSAAAMFRQLRSVALSKDGRVGIVGSEAGIAWVFDTISPDQARPLRGHLGPIYTVAITPCGGYAVTGGADKDIRLWNLGFDDELEAVFKGHDHLVARTLIDPSRDAVYSISSDGTLRIWDLRIGRALCPTAAGDAADWSSAEICALANGSDGVLLVGYKDGRVRALDGRSLTKKSSPPRHTDQVWAIAAIDGTSRAVSAGWDGRVRIWDVGTGKVESENLLPMCKVYGLRYADSGRIWCWGEWDKVHRSEAGGEASPGAAATKDSALRVVGGGAFLELVLPRLSLISVPSSTMPKCIRAMAFSPNGQTVFAGGTDGALVAFNTTDKVQSWAVLDTDRKGIYAISLTPNGKRLASGGRDRIIRVRDSYTGRLLTELPGHLAAITSLEFASDGVRLISASWDGTVRLWDTREGQCLAVAQLPGVAKVLAFGDGQSILAGTTRGELLMLDLINIKPLS